MWFAGVDWSDQKHDVFVMDEMGRQVGTHRVTHTVEGLDSLTSFLEAITGPDKKDQMACIIETNQGLLISSLLEAGFAVSPVNPKTIDRRRPAVFRQNGCY